MSEINNDPYYHPPPQQHQHQQQSPPQQQYYDQHQHIESNQQHHGHSHGSNNNVGGGGNYNGLPHLRTQVGHAQPYFSTYNDLNNSGGIPNNQYNNNKNIYNNEYSNNNNNGYNNNNNSNGGYNFESSNTSIIGNSITIKQLISSLNRDGDAKKLACWICVMLCFTIYEIFYGAYLESLGLVSDGFHALFDCIGMGIALLSMLVGGKKGSTNQEYTYGYDRWEVLGTFSNGCFLLFVSFFLFLESIERLLEPPHIHNHGRVISLATISLVINIVGFLFFKQKSNERRQHSSSSIRSENLLTISHHILVDSCTSLGVIFSSLVGKATGLEISDSLISIIIACIIVYDALPICIKTSSILLQTTPESLKINIANAIKDITVIDGVLEISEKHFWSHSIGNVVATIKVVTRKNCDDNSITHQIRNRLSFVSDLTIQIDKNSGHGSHGSHKHHHDEQKSHSHGHSHSHDDHDHDHGHGHGHSHNSGGDKHDLNENCDHEHEPVPKYQVTSPFSNHYTDIHSVSSPIPLYKNVEPEEEEEEEDHHHDEHHGHSHDNNHNNNSHGHSHDHNSHGHSHNH